MAAEEKIDVMLTRFASIVPRIQAAAQNRDDVTLRMFIDGEWSVHDILDHLRASYAIISYRVYAALVRDNPPMPAFDERQWATAARYSNLNFQASMITFAHIRDELFVVMQNLTAADWERTVQHETNGTMTLWTMMEHMVSHEEEHCEQIEKMVEGD